MISYTKPLDSDTLVIEIPRTEILALHGALITHCNCDSTEFLLSVLEAFYAGSDMTRFAPSVETPEDDCKCYYEIEPGGDGLYRHFIQCNSCYERENDSDEQPENDYDDGTPEGVDF